MESSDPKTEQNSTEFSERRQVEDALRLECQKLRAVINNLSVGIGITDAAGTTLSLNEEGLRIHGFSSEAEMLEKLDCYVKEFELRYPDGRVMPIEEWPASRAMDGEYVRDYEVVLFRPGVTEPRFISYSVVPIYSDNVELTLLVYNMLDLTERKKSEDRLRQAYDRLQQEIRECTRESEKLARDLDLLKDETFNELLNALEAIQAGQTERTLLTGSNVPQSSGADALDGLSARENEVLKLLASGKNTRQIADLLCISTKTVETHRSNIMKKLNMKNLADLTRYAVRIGLVDL